MGEGKKGEGRREGEGATLTSLRERCWRRTGPARVDADVAKAFKEVYAAMVVYDVVCGDEKCVW